MYIVLSEIEKVKEFYGKVESPESNFKETIQMT